MRKDFSDQLSEIIKTTSLNSQTSIQKQQSLQNVIESRSHSFKEQKKNHLQLEELLNEVSENLTPQKELPLDFSPHQNARNYLRRKFRPNAINYFDLPKENKNDSNNFFETKKFEKNKSIYPKFENSCLLIKDESQVLRPKIEDSIDRLISKYEKSDYLDI